MAIVVPLLLAPAACTTKARTVPPTPSSSCLVRSPAGPRADSVVVSGRGSIEATHAPVPVNAAERFAFAQSYETLIGVDCDGRAYPGLARAWTSSSGEGLVTFTLRDDSRFWSGQPLTAADVVAAWRASAQRPGAAGALARRVADAATVIDDRRLSVSLPDADARLLADPALAVYRTAAGSAWPEGSGPYRMPASMPAASRATFNLSPVRPDAGPRIVIRPSRATDARDEIDTGVDLLLSADPAVVAYTGTRGALLGVPLPWSQTYALAVPARTPANDAALAPLAGDTPAFRASLAGDVVRAEARASELPRWWEDDGSCTIALDGAAPPASAGRSTRVVYRETDHVARELAERFVALGRGATARPMSDAAFARALRAGNELAYVIALPRRSLDACGDRRALLESAPWLARAGGVDSSALVPLIDTRTRAVVRRDRASVAVEWDGTLRLIGPESR